MFWVLVNSRGSQVDTPELHSGPGRASGEENEIERQSHSMAAERLSHPVGSCAAGWPFSIALTHGTNSLCSRNMRRHSSSEKHPGVKGLGPFLSEILPQNTGDRRKLDLRTKKGGFR